MHIQASQLVHFKLNVSFKLYSTLPLPSEQIEVITRAKDMDPCMTSWKGAALMTCLEGSGELWIQQSEWNKHGVKILREKCPFIW